MARLYGVKFFKFLNIGNLFLDGEKVTATAAQLNAAGGAAIPDAADIPIADTDANYTSTDVEGALAEAAEAITAVAEDVAALPVYPVLRKGRVTLNGINPSSVLFQDSAVAAQTGSEVETFAITNGLTLIVNADGAGEETITFPATSGRHVGAVTGFGALNAQADNQFMIAVDGGDAQLVTLDLLNCDTGANTAAEMQTVIRALEAGVAPYTSVTVTFAQEVAGPPERGAYTIISAATTGTGSTIRITPATTANATEELAIGTAGTNTDGTGAGANNAVATAAEVAAYINNEAVAFTAEDVDGAVVLSGIDAGGSIVMGAGTVNAVLGFTGALTTIGATGLGYDTNMADDEYYVSLTPVGINKANKADITALSVHNKTTAGFDIVSTTDASAFVVDVVVLG